MSYDKNSVYYPWSVLSEYVHAVTPNYCHRFLRGFFTMQLFGRLWRRLGDTREDINNKMVLDNKLTRLLADLNLKVEQYFEH
jgi:predicted esterase